MQKLPQASSQLEALEGSQGVTALGVSNDMESGNAGGGIFSGGADGADGRVGGGGGGDDQAVASAFRILKVHAPRKCLVEVLDVPARNVALQCIVQRLVWGDLAWLNMVWN